MDDAQHESTASWSECCVHAASQLAALSTPEKTSTGALPHEAHRALRRAVLQMSYCALRSPATRTEDSPVPVEWFPSWTPPSPQSLALVEQSLKCGVDASASAATRALQMGEAYEALLSVELVVVDASWVCFRASGTWVSLQVLLALPREQRAAYLQSHAALGRQALRRVSSKLTCATTEAALRAALEPELRHGSELGQRLVLQSSKDRRPAGAHYTPVSVTDLTTERALRPLLDQTDPLELRICDPAMGSGAFLIAAAQVLARELIQRRPAAYPETDPSAKDRALREICETCLFGTDKDANAVLAARLALTLLSENLPTQTDVLERHLRCADALGGVDAFQWAQGTLEPDRFAPLSVSLTDGAERADRLVGVTGGQDHWPLLFPSVFERLPSGFDIILGNPPWVAYVGRAAQPLEQRTRALYERMNPGFRGYRTLQGMFLHRAACLLRPGGRLGLVLPTSTADLAGYAPTRTAHDTLCEVDTDLPDFGDGVFPGVFQPSMALLATRRDRPQNAAEPRQRATWPLARTDLSELARSLLNRMSDVPSLPPQTFGERGFQTTGQDVNRLHELAGDLPPGGVLLQQGSDLTEFCLQAPRVYVFPNELEGRFREPAEWNATAVLIRQTARYPIAALSKGFAFRNSLLGGFPTGAISAAALTAYLNSYLVRWLHYTRFRDARQGMPQLKIGHLRSLPQPPLTAESWRVLDTLGTQATGRGLSTAHRNALDDLVFSAFEVTPAERALVRDWVLSVPLPRSRHSAELRGGER